MKTMRQKALAVIKKDCQRYHINLREKSAIEIREWVDDVILDWLEDHAHEVQIYGAPYHLAKPS